VLYTEAEKWREKSEIMKRFMKARKVMEFGILSKRGNI
jgi:hypothetical protein